MKPNNIPPDMSKVPGGWLVNTSPALIGCLSRPTVKTLCPNVFLVKNLLHDISCDAINEFVGNAPALAPVSIQGMQEVTDDTIGSWRTTMFNEVMAEKLREVLYHTLAGWTVLFDEFDSTDWWQGDKKRTMWRYCGISPMLRWMRYKRGGKHAVHYDAGFIYPDDNYRTLYSFVLYLSTNETGATRIINDNQQDVPVWDRDHSDWSKEATPEQIVARSLPQKGSMLIFQHRIPHDVELFCDQNAERIIMRGDLIFEAI